MTPEEITDIVCEEFKISKDLVCKKQKGMQAVEARIAIFYFVRLLHSEIPLKAIGQKTIGRNLHYSTIIHGISKCRSLMQVYFEYREVMKIIGLRLNVVV